MYLPDTPPPKYYVLICCDTLGSECCYAKIRRIILLQFLWSSSGRELWESFPDAILIVRNLALQIGIMSHYVGIPIPRIAPLFLVHENYDNSVYREIPFSLPLFIRPQGEQWRKMSAPDKRGKSW